MDKKILKPYAIEIPDSKKEGCTGIYRNVKSKDHYFVPNQEYEPTVYDQFVKVAIKSPELPMLGYRPLLPNKTFGPYQYYSYRESLTKVQKLTSGLNYLIKTLNLNLNELNQLSCGIYSVNTPEWILTDLSLMASRLITVALYDTYGEDQLNYVIDHSEIQLVFITKQRLPNLLQLLNKKPKSNIKAIICLDSLYNNDDSNIALPLSGTEVIEAWCNSLNLKLFDFNGLQRLGELNPFKITNPVKPDDLYTLIYTSGTTGTPKGAMVTHFAYAAPMPNLIDLMHTTKITTLTYLSFLPLAHCMERALLYGVIEVGGTVGFYTGNIMNLISDISTFQPTFLAMVPRLLNRIYDQIHLLSTQQGLLPALFRMGLQSKMQNYKQGNGTISTIWDNLLFNRVKKVLGGKVNLIIVGSAPISKQTLDFLKITLCPNIVEGYGATETSAISSRNEVEDNDAGTVGPPALQTEMKLKDIPEMGYYSTDLPYPRGEILIRGPSVFKGYYKNDEATLESLDNEGFFKSGDVGLIDERGRFKIIDRKKNLFKLAQGEYISPERVENILSQHPAIQQAFIYGDSLQSSLVAVLVPEPEQFKTLIDNNLKEFKGKGLSEICKEDKVKQFIVNVLKKHGTKGGLNGFELVKNVHLELNPFTVENDLLTPTLKIKRKELKDFYQSTLDSLYTSMQ